MDPSILFNESEARVSWSMKMTPACHGPSFQNFSDSFLKRQKPPGDQQVKLVH